MPNSARQGKRMQYKDGHAVSLQARMGQTAQPEAGKPGCLFEMMGQGHDKHRKSKGRPSLNASMGQGGK
jgi:hypothetical protein